MSIINNLDSLFTKLEKLPENALESAEKGMTKTLLKMQSDAKKHAPNNDGDLGNSIHVSVERSEGNIEGKVYTVNDHALYVEYGTGPVGEASKKEIPPGVALQYRDKGWLIPVKYFPNYKRYGMIAIEIKGELFIPTRGQKAQQFMMPAAKMNADKFKPNVSKELKKGMKELSK